MIKKHTSYLVLVFLFFIFSIKAQSEFKFYGTNNNVQSIRFQLINNLIVIPVDVNGSHLSFILDTGVDKTILFNISQIDSVGLNNVKKITLQGLGGGAPIEALLSQKNNIKIKSYISTNENIYVILRDKFDVSSKMGTTIHGVIGYRLLKDAITEINYNTKKIYFHNPKTFKSPKCRKCEVFPLQFYRNKPYINAKVQLDTIGNVKTAVKLLIDTGGGDAIWLFENTKAAIKTPKRSFRDILGEGFSGTIYGNRSRIKELSIGRFSIKNPTVSFLDSASTYYARQFKTRNGSIGGNILKRFKVWIDYQNKQITLKKSGSFRGGFDYNMSGVDVVYNGKILVKELENILVGEFYTNQSKSRFNTISFISNYQFRFKPSYIIHEVLKGSPGGIAGLQKGDIISKINGEHTHQFSLKQLLGKLQERHNKRIKMVVKRGFQVLKFEFRLLKKI
mgnify:CR=1 FL=1